MNIRLKETERLDELHRNGYWIIQDPEKFCFGMDAVLLSGYVKVKPGERLWILEQGQGLFPYCWKRRQWEATLPDWKSSRKARIWPGAAWRLIIWNERSTLSREISKKLPVCLGCLFRRSHKQPSLHDRQHGLTNPGDAKKIARHEILCTLEDVIREGAALLRPGGRLCLVHRPFRLAEIITLMVKYKTEPKRMRLVYPYADREPNMVLIEGQRGAKSGMTVEKPLIVYQEPGEVYGEIYDIYGY